MHSSWMRTARFGGQCEYDWQTGVKILPCPKLRLQAVMKIQDTHKTLTFSLFKHYKCCILN